MAVITIAQSAVANQKVPQISRMVHLPKVLWNLGINRWTGRFD